MAKGYIIDLKNVDAVFTGDFGNFTVRNYGEDGTAIQVASVDDNLYNINVGSFGDALMNKSYKPQNMRLTIKALRRSADYARMKAIVALELTGQSNVFSVLVRDNNSKETIFSPTCVMEKMPPMAWGTQPSPDVEFQIFMSSVVYTAPVLGA